MSEADDAFLHVHLEHMQPKSWSQDYTITSGSAIWLQNLNCARTRANGKKMPRKCLFQDCWRKDIAYQEIKDKLDKHYAWCVACEIQLIFVCFLLLWWSLQNLLLVLTSPYLAPVQVPGNHVCSSIFLRLNITFPKCCWCKSIFPA